MAKPKTVSLTGRLMRYILKGLHVLPDLQQDRQYQKAVAASQKPYHLSTFNRFFFSLKEYQGHSDVLALYPPERQNKEVIFYLHGGGYWDQPSIMHYRLAKKLVQGSQKLLVMPIYPKAPAHQADEVIAWTEAVFEQILNQERITADQVILMGDSAGAGLALSLLQRRRNQGQDLPKKVILISPWFDLSDTNPAMPTVQPLDPMLQIPILDLMAAGYRGHRPLKDPLISPLYADLKGMPAIKVLTGTDDVLHPDAVAFQNLADKNGWAVQTDIYPAMYHDFPEIPIPEGQAAIKQMITWINEVD